MATLENVPADFTILVIDDEADLRDLLSIHLRRLGVKVLSVGSVKEAKKVLQEDTVHACLTDMRLPDGLGLDVVSFIREIGKNIPIAVITAYGNTDNAILALKNGAYDYLAKPIATDQLMHLVSAAIKLQSNSSSQLTSQPAHNKTAGQKPSTQTTSSGKQNVGQLMLGQSAAITEILGKITQLARTMAPVAIKGESGSGKELAARMIHQLSPRADGPFVAVNCGAIPDNLLESEFFGYKKGAFTGADHDKQGFFQAADGGTLFLDEVADLPLSMQVKLLRVIQEKKVRRLGETIEQPTHVRILSASHKDLTLCVEQGLFRQDLYYRLNVIDLYLPPLRERKSDIPIIAEALLQKLTHDADYNQPTPLLSQQALDALLAYDFPGNVRELENVLERALAFCHDDVILAEHLHLPKLNATSTVNKVSTEHTSSHYEQKNHVPDSTQGTGTVENHLTNISASNNSNNTPSAEPIQLREDPSAVSVSTDCSLGHISLPTDYSLPDYLDAIEKHLINQSMQHNEGSRTRTANQLGITVRTLRYRMSRLNITSKSQHEGDVAESLNDEDL